MNVFDVGAQVGDYGILIHGPVTCWRCSKNAVPGSPSGLCQGCRLWLAGEPSIADRTGWLPFTAWQHRVHTRFKARHNHPLTPVSRPLTLA